MALSLWLCLVALTSWTVQAQVSDCPTECQCTYPGGSYLLVSCELDSTYPSAWPENATHIVVNFTSSINLPADALRGRTDLTFTVTGSVGNVETGAFQDLSGFDPISFDAATVGTVQPGAFRRLAGFGQVDFSNSAINEISARAFEDIEGSASTVFAFADSTISNLRTGAFRNLTNFGQITFTTCEITTLEDGVFDFVSNAGLLLFAEMTPSPWPVNPLYLSGLPDLDTLKLDITSMELSIAQSAFSGLSGLDTLDYTGDQSLLTIAQLTYKDADINTVEYNNVAITDIQTNAFTADGRVDNVIFDMSPIANMQSAAFFNVTKNRVYFLDSYITTMAADSFSTIPSISELQFFTSQASFTSDYLDSVGSLFADVASIGLLWYNSGPSGSMATTGITLNTDMFGSATVDLLQFTNILINEIEANAFRGLSVTTMRFFSGTIADIRSNAFSTLANVALIEFINAATPNIETLAFSNMTDIASIRFYNNPVLSKSEMQFASGAFSNIQSLGELLFDSDVSFTSHSYNFSLATDVFTDLTGVNLIRFHSVYMTQIGALAFSSCEVANIEFRYCTIGDIANSAFDELGDVSSILFDDTPIGVLNSGAFSGLNSVGELKFYSGDVRVQSPHIGQLDDDTFTSIPSVDTLIFGAGFRSEWLSNDFALSPALLTQSHNINRVEFNRINLAQIQASSFYNSTFDTLEFSLCDVGVLRSNAFTDMAMVDNLNFPRTTFTIIETKAFSEFGVDNIEFDHSELPALMAETFFNMSTISRIYFLDTTIASMAEGTFAAIDQVDELQFFTSETGADVDYGVALQAGSLSGIENINLLWLNSAIGGAMNTHGITAVPDMFKDVRTTLLQFTNVNILQIEAFAFRAITADTIRFFAGTIGEIKAQSFATLSDVSLLEFIRTPVTQTVRSLAFSDMSNIGTIRFFSVPQQTGYHVAMEAGAFSNIHTLTELLFDSQLSYISHSYNLDITSDLFFNLTQVGLIKFHSALIGYIGPQAYQDCQVDNIEFHFCTINEISNGAFDKLGDVGSILFYDSPIADIQATAFTGLQTLGELTFHSGDVRVQNPHLGQVAAGAFSSIQGLDTLTFSAGFSSDWFTNGLTLSPGLLSGVSTIANVRFDRVVIPEIQANAFQGSTFTSLQFPISRIAQISTGAFSGIVQTNIIFTFATITTIQTRAFSDFGANNIEFEQCTIPGLVAETFYNLDDVNRIYFIDTFIPSMAVNTFQQISKLNELQFATTQSGFSGNYTTSLTPGTLSGIEDLGLLWFSTEIGGGLNIAGMSVKSNMFNNMPKVDLLQFTNVNVDRVENNAFAGCNVDRIRFFRGVTSSLDTYAFRGLTGMSGGIEFIESPIAVIKSQAFSSMSDVSEISFTFSSSLTPQANIGVLETRAFSDITGLNELLFDGDASYINYNYQFDLTSDLFHNLTDVGLIKFSGVLMSKIGALSFDQCKVSNIDFYFGNITDIENQAFTNLLDVGRIEFYDTPIGSIQSTAFAEIQSLGQLSFVTADRRRTDPHIGSIASDALTNIASLGELTFRSLTSGQWWAGSFPMDTVPFTNLQNIGAIRFDRVRIDSIEAGLFDGSSLDGVYFDFTPITTVKTDAFATGATINDVKFESTAITTFEARAFNNYNAGSIRFISAFFMSSLPVDLFYDMTVDSISFSDTSLASLPANFFSGIQSATDIQFHTTAQNPNAPNFGTIDSMAFQGMGPVDMIWFNSAEGAAMNVFPMNLTSGLLANLPNTRLLQFNRMAIEEIQADSFQDSHIETIRFFFSEIGDIKTSGFGHLSNVDNIYFQGTPIAHMETRAFSNIANMTSLRFHAYPSQNPVSIGTLDPEPFHTIHSLDELLFDSDPSAFTFSYNFSLSSDLFTDLTDIGRVQFSGVYIENVAGNTFSGCQAAEVVFDFCQIIEVSNDAFAMPTVISRLEFSDTPIGTLRANAFANTGGINDLIFSSGNYRMVSPHFGTLEIGVFQNAGNLQSLTFSSGFSGSLRQDGIPIEANQFSNMNVGTLLFQMVKIPTIEASGLSGGVFTKLHFISCLIESAPAQAFTGITADSVDLEFTTLQGYASRTFSTATIREITFVSAILNDGSLPTEMFHSLTNIERIFFSDTPVTNIGSNAFSLVSLDELQFYTRLSNPVAPIGSMHADAFRAITTLGLLWFNSVEGGSFDTQGMTITDGPFNSLQVESLIQFNRVTIPAIESNAFKSTNTYAIRFYFCKVTDIETNAFSDLTAVDQIFFQGTSVESIKSQAFHTISGMSSITFHAYPSQMTSMMIGSIDTQAFSGISGLNELAFDSEISASNFSYNFDLTEGLLHEITDLSTFKVTMGKIGTIATNAFIDCEVDTVDISYSSIGDLQTNAFTTPSDVSTIQFIETPIDTIYQSAFSTTNKIGTLNFFAGTQRLVTPHFRYINAGAFDDIAGGLDMLIIRASVNSDLDTRGMDLTTGMFSTNTDIGTIRLQSVKIPNIMADAFKDSTINDIYFLYCPIETIQGSALSNLQGVNSIKFELGQVSYIESNALNNVRTTQDIHFLSAGPITEISTDAFGDVDGVQLLLFENTPIDYVRSRAFSGLDNVEEFRLTDSVVDCMDTSAFNDMGSITNPNFGDALPCMPPANNPPYDSKHCQEDGTGNEECTPKATTIPTTPSPTPTTTKPTTTTTPPGKTINI